MTLEQQVCNLELSKKLKELGVMQDSVFYFDWTVGGLEIVYGIEKTAYRINNKEIYKNNMCSAFTVAELCKILPKGIQINKCLHYGHWKIEYGKNWDKEPKEILNPNETLADSLAKMLIYLLENNLITL